MGRIGRLIKTAIDSYIVQTVEAYAGANITAETFAPSGDDSPPLPEDRIVLVQTDGTGNFVAAGVLSASRGAQPGERILYSRSADGAVQAAVKLLNDGKIEMLSPADFSVSAKGKLIAKGNDVEINGANTVLTGGNLTCKGKATASGEGPFCAIPACLFTGAPQCGTDVSGT